jgi:hypothetical protein
MFKQCTQHWCSNDVSRWMTYMSIPYEPMKNRFHMTIIAKFNPWILGCSSFLFFYCTRKIRRSSSHAIGWSLELVIFKQISSQNFSSSFDAHGFMCIVSVCSLSLLHVMCVFYMNNQCISLVPCHHYLLCREEEEAPRCSSTSFSSSSITLYVFCLNYKIKWYHSTSWLH